MRADRRRPGLGAAAGVGLALLGVAPAAATWAPVAPMPTPRALFGIGVLGATLYAVGGEGEFLRTMDRYDPGKNAWRSKTPMPTVREEFGVAVVGGTIYAVGGFNGGDLGALEAYDPATDSWTTLASLLVPRSHLSAATVGGRLYAIGGVSGTILKDTVESYNPLTNSWVLRASLPFPLAHAAAAGLGGRVYVTGGSAGGFNANTKTFVYDPGTNKWTDIVGGNLKSGREHLAMAASGGSLYAVGGGKTVSVNLLEVYDPTSSKWSDGAAMAGKRRLLGAAAIGATVYAVGGQDKGLLKTVEAYDLATKSWRYVADLPSARRGLGVAAVGGYLYAMGGSLSFQDAVEAYDSGLDAWRTIPRMPTPRAGLSAGSPGNGKIYAIGGLTETTTGSLVQLVTLRTNEEYNPVTKKWTRRAPLPKPRRYAASASAGGKLYVIGGMTSDTIMTDSVFAYDPATDSWTSRSPMPTPRMLAAAAVLNGRIYVAGGATALYGGASQSNIGLIWLDEVEIYDPVLDAWSVAAPLLAARAAAGAGTLGGDVLYVTGGISGTVTHASTELYNPDLDRWDRRPELPQARHGLGAAVAGATLFAVGGRFSRAAGLTSKGVWTTSGTVFDATDRYSRAGAVFTAGLTVEPSVASPGDVVVVRLTLTNSGDITATAFVPAVGFANGASLATLSAAAVTGAAVAAPPAGVRAFSWTATLVGAGTVRFAATATGEEWGTGGVFSSSVVSPVLTSAFRGTLAVQLGLSPLPLVTGAGLRVALTVSNTGGATVYDVTGSLGLVAGAGLVQAAGTPFQASTLDLPPGSGTRFVWTYTVSGAGYLLYSATATGTDAVFGPVTASTLRSSRPSAPLDLAIEQGDGRLVLSWRPNPAFEMVTTYRVYRSLAPGVAVSPAAPYAVVSTTGFVDTAVVNGTTYYYRVEAASADGTGSPSAERPGTPLSLPGAPGEVRVTSTGPNPMTANPLRGERVQLLLNVPSGPGTLRVRVYTLAGEEVRTLHDGLAAPGTRIVEWDGLNARGNLAASGGYVIVVLFPDDKRVVRKAAILK